MERQKDKLIEIMDSEFGLLDKLLKSKSLTRGEFAKINAEATMFSRNEILLNHIFQKGKEQDLIAALLESGQNHVVNWIRGNGEYETDFGLDWPLSEEENKILDTNRESLIDTIDTSGLLIQLYSKGVVNIRQRDLIQSKPTNYKSNEVLVDIVTRLSRKSFFLFITCLRESNQSYIADILENKGAIVRIHATLESENLTEAETQIVNEMTNLLFQRSTSLEQANRLLSAMQLNVLAVKRGQSIVLYIACIREEEFVYLYQIIDNLEMKRILQQLFNLLVENFKIKVLMVKIHDRDITSAKQLFQKECTSHKSTDRPTGGKSDRFQEEILNYLKQTKIFSTEASEKIQAIIETQVDFESQIELAENAIVNGRRELIEIIDKCTETLLRELISIKQEWLKKFNNEKEDMENHKSNIQTLELNMNELLSDASKECTLDISDIRSENEGLHTSHIHRIQRHIHTIQVSFEASHLEDFLKAENCVGALKVKMEKELIEEKAVKIEKQLEEGKAAPLHLAGQLDLSTSFSAQVKEVYGVTKLDNEIFVLCAHPTFVLGFDDQRPFRLQRKLELSEIENPFDIASSKKSKCLYIADRGNQCIWKLTTDVNQLTELLSDVGEPFTFSLSSDDQLLILRWSEPSSQLYVYNKTGILSQILLLPSDIQMPIHCVRKPNGEFIISHKIAMTKTWTISILGNDGQTVVRQFCPRDRSEEMSVPWHLALDCESDLLFVADYSNNRVNLVDLNSLDLKHVLPIKEKRSSLPLRLFYDSKERQLIVGRFFNKVNIYCL